MDYAYYNGWCGRLDDARIPLSDRAIYFGDGVYDCMIGMNGKIYQYKEHIDRLRVCARRLNLKVNMNDEELLETIVSLVLMSGYERFTVYIQVSRFAKKRQHATDDFEASNILITVTEHKAPKISDTISLISCEDIRYKLCDVKTLNLLPSVLASKHALDNGCDEAVFIRSGVVTECSRSNISILKSGVLITHPLTHHILPGITRANLLNCAREIGIPTEERCYGYKELKEADEVLVTSTTTFVRRAEFLDSFSLRCADFERASLLSSRLVTNYLGYCC